MPCKVWGKRKSYKYVVLTESIHRYFLGVNGYFNDRISPYIPSALDCKWYNPIKIENKTSSDKFPYF